MKNIPVVEPFCFRSLSCRSLYYLYIFLILFAYLSVTSTALGQTSELQLDLKSIANSDSFVPAMKILAVITVISLAPAILLMMTSFTRILIVLGFLRQALGTQTMPPNQIL